MARPCYSKDLAKVTSKLQVTIPKALADRYGIAPGAEIGGFPPAMPSGSSLVPNSTGAWTSLAGSVYSIRRPSVSWGVDPALAPRGQQPAAVGHGRSCTDVAALVDTNVLVYRYDARFPEKQRIATELLRAGIEEDSIRLSHQAIIEFVARVSRPLRREPALLTPVDARREAEEMLLQFEVLYPDEEVVRIALRGAAAYGLAWFDAHMWACAERFALTELISEDFEDGRLYGTVQAVNPFSNAS